MHNNNNSNHYHQQMNDTSSITTDGHYQRPHVASDCARCKQPFGRYENMAQTGPDEFWHLRCFVCAHCFRPFENLEFYERFGRKYCRQDFITLFAPCCASCHRYITMGRFTKAINKSWTPQCCIICDECDIPPGGFVKPDNELELRKPRNGSPVCGACHQLIEGERYVTALGKHWHVEHFACAECDKPFRGRRHFEMNGLAYCEEDCQRIYGYRCSTCAQLIEGEAIVALDRRFCSEHFCCHFCSKRMRPNKTKFFDVQSELCCKKCYKRFPADYRKQLAKQKKLERRGSVSSHRTTTSFK